MGKGTDAARALGGSAAHAQLIDDMKDQLLIVLLNRLGGTVDIPVSEVDGTGSFVASFQIVDSGQSAKFHFVVSKKS